MSLRVRLIVSIVAVLLLSLVAGGVAACWHAVASVRAEMQAALTVGAQTARNALPAASETGLLQLVHIFDGDRHVWAVLRDSAGREIASSILSRPAKNIPGWFVLALAPSQAPVRFDAAGGTVLLLQPDPVSEIGEVWSQFKDDFSTIAAAAGLSTLLVSLVVGQALRPLDRLTSAISSLGSGQYAIRVEPGGPPELVRLAEGLNLMAERLDAAEQRNRRLGEQILALQEEERADLARDLHDEVGPFLFAVNLDAAFIENAALSNQKGEIPERARAIRESVGHMQRQVRDMLHRLRPANPVEVGLVPALEALVGFWRGRQPAIAFELRAEVGDGTHDPATMAAIYRLVQESVSNAVRHGNPTRVEVDLRFGEAGDFIVEVADDGTGFGATSTLGFGLTGMHERVEALGGRLSIDNSGHGLKIAASLPRAGTTEDV